jgi:uncharacterized protein (TIGR02246 family)
MPTPRRAAAFATLAVLLSVTACHAPGLATDDHAMIRARAALWADSARSRDFATLADLYTEDGALLPPNGEAVRGRAAIRAFFDGFPRFTNLSVREIEADGCGDVAWVWGTYTMQVVVPGADGPVRERGKYLEVWRRGDDGVWRIARDMFSSDQPAAGGS